MMTPWRQRTLDNRIQWALRYEVFSLGASTGVYILGVYNLEVETQHLDNRKSQKVLSL